MCLCLLKNLQCRNEQAHDIVVLYGSFDEKLVHEVQTHFLEVFHPLARPADEHEVELPGVVDSLRSQLLQCKVGAPPKCACQSCGGGNLSTKGFE